MSQKPYEILGVGRVRMTWISREGLEITSEQEEEVDYQWNRAVKKSDGHLFNGAYFNLLHWQTKRDRVDIVGHFDEYRNFYVHRLLPRLGLGVRAVGVSAITIFDDGGEDYALAARRAPKMTQYPGLMELVPSGTIDRECADEEGIVRAEAKAIEELHEEAGIPFSRIEQAQAFAFTYDRLDDNYDVCCILRIDARAQELRHGIKHCAEYDDPQIIRVADLKDWAEDQGDQLMPVSWAVIEAYAQWTK